MAATGFTPVYIYASGTTGNIPSASNLTNTTNGSEIALNYFDGKLFYKNSSNSVVTVPLLQSSGSQNGWLSSTDWTTFNNKSPAAGSSSITTVGTITSGTWNGSTIDIAHGGTNATSFTAKSGNVAGLVFFDGTKLTNDATVTDVGYDTSTNTFQAKYAYINSGLLTIDNSTTGYPTLGTASGAFRMLATANAFGLFGGLDGGTGRSWLQSMRTDGAVAYDIRLQPVGGDVRIGAGNLIIETSGKGIDFSATSDGSGTATSELLADYEEGTWTPTLTAGTGSITSYTATGSYTKVGRLVTVTLNSTITDAGTGGGALSVTGLPYTNNGSFNASGVGRENAVTGYILQASITAGTTTMVVRTYSNTTPIATNAAIRVTTTYFV